MTDERKFYDPRDLSDEEFGTIARMLLGKVLTIEQSNRLHEIIRLTTTVEHYREEA